MKTDHTIVGEKLLFIVNEHWIKYLPAILLLLASWVLWTICIWIGYVLLYTNSIASHISIFAGHLLLLFFHHAAFYNFLSASTRQTCFTNRRILSLQQQLWVSDDIVDTALWQVKSMEVQLEGVFAQVFNYGSLIFNGGELPTIERIPNPYRIHAKLIPHIQSMQPALQKGKE